MWGNESAAVHAKKRERREILTLGEGFNTQLITLPYVVFQHECVMEQDRIQCDRISTNYDSPASSSRELAPLGPYLDTP